MSVPALLKSCRLRPGAIELAVARAEVTLGQSFPPDYRELLLQTDGFEGPIGNERYLQMWSVDQMQEGNVGYDVSDNAPGVTLLGTNGGGTGYGFRVRDGRFEYVSMPLIDLVPDPETSSTFEEFLTKLLKG